MSGVPRGRTVEAQTSSEETTMTTALVGYNASDGSEDALAFACMLRRTLGYELVVVSCVVDPFDRLGGHYLATLRQEAEDALASARRPIEDDRDISFHLVRGTSAGAALHHAAERFDADLVIVGATHHRATAELFAPSVTHQTIQAAPCAVAVAPAGFRERPHARLGLLTVAVDDSPESLDALMRAGDVARRTGAEIRVLHAHHPGIATSSFAAVSYADPDFLEEARSLAQDKLDRATAALRARVPDVTVSDSLIAGDAAERLIEASTESDLLFIGSRGYGPLRRALLGSVSGRVVRGARCPVIVTPRAAVEAKHAVDRAGEAVGVR
jgi:nucleotide-binding universal stress UspA family protein